jgi:hypothetical protein
MKIYTKDEITKRLKEIKAMGWIKNARHGNQGGIGNTIEDLLDIEENNLPIPNAAEGELKCQRVKGGRAGSLITLLHSEPSPRALKFVPKIFLPLYGWPHRNAGKKYPKSEMSFRQTISGASRTDRGFLVVVNRAAKKVLISFDASTVDPRHAEWLKTVKKRVGLKELNPQPYWGFDDLEHAGIKLHNCFYVQAQVKKGKGKEFYLYDRIVMLQQFSFEKFLEAIEKGWVLVDFDARTGHNHGTKFRLRQDKMPELYEESTVIA